MKGLVEGGNGKLGTRGLVVEILRCCEEIGSLYESNKKEYRCY